MLSQKQSNEFNRAKRLKEFLDANTMVFSSFVPFFNAYSVFSNQLATFTAIAVEKEGTTIGITQTKDALKKQIAKGYAGVLQKTFTYAKLTNNTVLKEAVNHPESEIYRLKDAEILPFITNINENVFTQALLNNPAFVPYNVTLTQITDLTAKATEFNTLIGKSGVSQSGLSTANTSINEVIKLIQSEIEDMDNLIVEFETSNPQFVNGYHLNSELENRGVRHNGIAGTVRKNQLPAPAAVIKIVNSKKEAKSDSEGNYSLTSIRPGIYEVEVTTATGEKHTQSIQIRAGKVATLDFVL